MAFTHLHVHTEYSLLDGAGKIGRLLDKCKELGMDSLAITDHGAMFGVVEFYKAAKDKGIRPIIGCEVYVAPGKRTDKTTGDREYAHLVLLAKNETGYRNLIYLVTQGYVEGFYYKPRIDYDLLAEHCEGLVCLSACLGGDIPQLIVQGNAPAAEKLALRLDEMFGRGNFYLELQDHGIREQRLVNAALSDISQRTGIPLVATNDLHYVEKEDAEAHEVLLCIQTKKTMQDENRMRFETNEFYLKSPQEMEKLFAWCPEALENTAVIADMCRVDFEFGNYHLPDYQVPEGFNTHYDYLRHLAYEGFARRYAAPTQEAKERIEYELSMIKQMGYVDYFLIVWDFINYARSQKIMVGPGRGSGAGSIVAYCLGITSVEPLQYDLIFERFLNPERVSMPDFDIDFCYERRSEVIDYVVRKYGEDRVAQIITFGTMAARAVIRDVGRALGMSYAEVDRIAKKVPFQLKMTIDKALELSPELAAEMEDPRVAHLIKIAKKLEGLPRNPSTHAAGVVISKEPLVNLVPLYKVDEGVTTQFTMTLLEELGLLKMDFLGLRTLTVIRDTVAMVQEEHGVMLDMDHLPFDDPAVYRLLCDGDTDGVFQLESGGMRSFLKNMQPSNFEDIIAGISLYRPGPMDQIPRYVAWKKDPSAVEYAHPLLQRSLKATYGCMVYQEQVMQIVRDIAGYSLGRSDLVRRAMAKKKRAVMEKEREIFIHGLEEDGKVIVPGAVRNGVSEEVANRIYDEMMAFAEYAFNKSHAAAYAVVAYQTGWLKAHYPTEFMAALLNSMMGNMDKAALYIQVCRQRGIEVLGPDVNRSQPRFSVDKGTIRVGLAAVKNVSEQLVEEVVAERRRSGPFTSLFDFCTRMAGAGLNKRMVECLILAGAFDSLGSRRAQLMASGTAVDGANNEAKNLTPGQVSLFDMGGSEAVMEEPKLPTVEEFTQAERLHQEKEMTGVYLTGHPLLPYRQQCEKCGFSLRELSEAAEDNRLAQQLDGRTVELCAIITAVKTKITRDGKNMAIVNIEDLTDATELMVFASCWEKCGHLIEPEALVRIRARVSAREEEMPKLIADTVSVLTDDTPKKLYVKVPAGSDAPALTARVTALAALFPGHDELRIYVEADKKTYRPGRGIKAGYELEAELVRLLGDSNVVVR